MQDVPRPAQSYAGGPPSEGKSFDLGAWVKKNPGMTALGAVGGVVGFLVFSGLGGGSSAVATGPYADDVEVAITDCWQGSNGYFHAEIEYTNTSGELLNVFSKVGFYDEGTQVQDAIDSRSLPAGRSAVSDASFFTDTGMASDLTCELIEMSVRPS